MMTRREVVNVARAWLRTPFVPQASVKGAGCDCAGLIIGVARELALLPADFDPGPYKQQPDGTMIRLCDAYLERCEPAAIAPGDVVAIQWEREPQHLAIIVDYPGDRLGIVHAVNRCRCVAEHILSKKWRALITDAYRFPGVAA